MTKKAILFFCLTPLVLAAIVAWRIYSVPYGITQTDLSASRVRDAVSILQKERLLWSKLKGVSAHVELTMAAGSSNEWDNTDRKVKLECDVAMKQVSDSVYTAKDNTHYLYPYAVTMSNIVDGWTLETDGTETNTTITVNDKSKDPRRSGLRVGDLIALPLILISQKDHLLGAYNDSLCQQAATAKVPSFSEFLKHWGVWQNKDAKGKPHSYVFKQSGSGAEISFEDRWLNQYVIIEPYEKTVAKKIFLFSEPVVVDGVSYPTKVEIRFVNFRVLVKISDLRLTMTQR
jgi:hypothetical protein